MPCQELFDQQSEFYKNKILNETDLAVSIEASETNFGKKYTGLNGIALELMILGKAHHIKISTLISI